MRRLPLIASMLLLTACPASSGAIMTFDRFTIDNDDEPLPKEIIVGAGKSVKINAKFIYTVSGAFGWKGKLEISGDQNGQSIAPSGGSVELQLPSGTDKELTIASNWELKLPEGKTTEAFSVNYQFVGAKVNAEDELDTLATQSVTLKRE